MNSFNDLKTLNKLVSFIMPVFNSEKYIVNSINSLIIQTYKNIEIIIVNDGSTDNTKKIIESFSIFDKRVKVYNLERNGLVYCLNYGINKAKGYWIARMDADDISLPNRIERQLFWLDQTKADICGTFTKTFGSFPNRIIKHSLNDQSIKIELIFGSSFSHPSVVIKKHILLKFLYNSKFEYCEDYDLWLRLAVANFKMTNIPEILLYYRIHSEQISANKIGIQTSMKLELLRNYLNNNNLYNFNEDLISEFINLLSYSPITDYSKIKSIINILFENTNTQQRELVYKYLSRIFLKNLLLKNNLISEWIYLNKKFKINVNYFIVGFFYLTLKFNIDINKILLFRKLNNIYIWLTNLK